MFLHRAGHTARSAVDWQSTLTTKGKDDMNQDTGEATKPHPADAGASGQCEHGQPLWGVCTACKRYDADSDQPGSTGLAHFAPGTH